MTDRELMQQALEALEYPGPSWPEARQSIATALRERLAQPEQEPVAWVTGWHDGHCVIRAANPSAILPIGIALYTTPPRREWVGLTEEEFSHGLQMSSNTSWMKAAKWVEAKLRKKNSMGVLK